MPDRRNGMAEQKPSPLTPDESRAAATDDTIVTVIYEFSYDFVPNDGTDEPVCTRVDGRELDGEIRVTDILISGKPGPVCGEAMNLMWRAAVIDYRDSLDHQWREWHQHQRPRPVGVSRPNELLRTTWGSTPRRVAVYCTRFATVCRNVSLSLPRLVSSPSPAPCQKAFPNPYRAGDHHRGSEIQSGLLSPRLS